jgi:hypothetical protein
VTSGSGALAEELYVFESARSVRGPGDDSPAYRLVWRPVHAPPGRKPVERDVSWQKHMELERQDSLSEDRLVSVADIDKMTQERPY